MKSRIQNTLKALGRFSPSLHTETLLLVCCLFFAGVSNQTFFSRIVQGMSATSPSTWAYVLAVFILLTALHYILLSLLVFRPYAKPLLVVIFLLTGSTTYFIEHFGIYMNVEMAQNVLQTDIKEARELLAPAMMPHFILYVLLPSLLLWRITLLKRTFKKTLVIRLVGLVAAIAVSAGALFTISQDFVPKMRENKDWRHLITPGNFISALTQIAFEPAPRAAKDKDPIGRDAKPAIKAEGDKPLLLVLFVGETVRAQNWGLNGYARQTTPELAARNVINFPKVSSCGTNTAVSLPCMFSSYGRLHYDEDKIRNSETLLNVFEHAGAQVLWRDNQSGCKGVCDGIKTEFPHDNPDPALCNGDTCFDEILMKNLGEKLNGSKDALVVMHTMGNHGPAYYLRYPAAFAKFQPVCQSSELGSCSQQQIVNAYDNAIFYTDHVLAQAIDQLRAMSKDRATALIYLSDHGESLGENGLYLHSLPRSLAPETQTRVPMVMWFSDTFSKQRHLDVECLRKVSTEPASHDNLFHTLLGLGGISTTAYQSSMDLSHHCRAQ